MNMGKKKNEIWSAVALVLAALSIWAVISQTKNYSINDFLAYYRRADRFWVILAVFVAVRPRLSVTFTVMVAVPLTVSSPLVKSTLAVFTVFLYAFAVYPLMLVSIFVTVLLSTPLPVVWMRTAHLFCT